MTWKFQETGELPHGSKDTADVTAERPDKNVNYTKPTLCNMDSRNDEVAEVGDSEVNTWSVTWIEKAELIYV